MCVSSLSTGNLTSPPCPAEDTAQWQAFFYHPTGSISVIHLTRWRNQLHYVSGQARCLLQQQNSLQSCGIAHWTECMHPCKVPWERQVDDDSEEVFIVPLISPISSKDGVSHSPRSTLLVMAAILSLRSPVRQRQPTSAQCYSQANSLISTLRCLFPTTAERHCRPTCNRY